MMNVIICGGRDWWGEYQDVQNALLLLGVGAPSAVLSGCCAGADYFGASWALLNRIQVIKFHPLWAKHGRAAGPIRNSAMVAEADAVIAFPTPGSKGTWDTIRKALKKGIPVVVG